MRFEGKAREMMRKMCERECAMRMCLPLPHKRETEGHRVEPETA